MVPLNKYINPINISHSSNDSRTSILTSTVSVLMPVCNEADVIEMVIEEWHKEVFIFLPQGSELVLDDASDDGTSEILEKLITLYPYIRVNRSKRDGFDKAAKRLYKLAVCPLIFFTDSDGQYPPSDFWKVASLIGGNGVNGYDMVHGYKVDRRDPFYRIIGSALFNKIVRMIFSSTGHDINSAFRLIRRELVINQVPQLKHVPMLINAEFYIRSEHSNYKILDVPIMHRDRPVGTSRSLPMKSFIKHGLYAIWGMLKLKIELTRRHSRKE